MRGKPDNGWFTTCRNTVPTSYCPLRRRPTDAVSAAIPLDDEPSPTVADPAAEPDAAAADGGAAPGEPAADESAEEVVDV